MSIVDLDKLPKKEIVPGFLGSMIHTDQVTVAYFDIKAGSILPEHHHVHEQISSLIKGEFELTIDGKIHQLKPGKVAVIPSNIPHSGKAITDCTIIDVFSPTRDDYR
jgi:quercetin dioxygenase-like cupin family protein